MKSKFFIIVASVIIAFTTSCTPKSSEATNCDTKDSATVVAENVKDVIMARRSIRKYQDRAISTDTLNMILEEGINAPSGMNKQSYEIRVFNNPERIAEVREALDGKLYNAAALLFIAADSSYDCSVIDCGLLTENILLSAWSYGIGSCCLGGPVRALTTTPAGAEILNKLGFSEGYNLVLCVSLGYPAESPEAKPRVTDKIKYID